MALPEIEIPTIALVIGGYVLFLGMVSGVILMVLSGRRIAIEEIRSAKLRFMHRPASIKGKSRINKIG